MNSHIYVSGHQSNPLDIARIRLERADPAGDLLGPLQAKQIGAGDIIPTTMPTLGSPSPERGIYVSREPALKENKEEAIQVIACNLFK